MLRQVAQIGGDCLATTAIVAILIERAIQSQTSVADAWADRFGRLDMHNDPPRCAPCTVHRVPCTALDSTVGVGCTV